MKVGDLVTVTCASSKGWSGRPVGLVVQLIQKKVWRTHLQGKNLDWDAVDPEPHAVVLYSHNNGTISIPTVELEVISENR